MQVADVVIQSEQIKICNWPHARTDCPSVWKGSKVPCGQCYCYVCDVPVSECDDVALHASANGRTPEWARKKRCRRALVNTWTDIPDLVNLLVSFSVDESKVGSGHRRSPSRRVTSPTSVNVEDQIHDHVNVVKVLHYGEDKQNGGKDRSNVTVQKLVSANTEEHLADAFCGLKIKPEKADTP